MKQEYKIQLAKKDTIIRLYNKIQNKIQKIQLAVGYWFGNT